LVFFIEQVLVAQIVHGEQYNFALHTGGAGLGHSARGYVGQQANDNNMSNNMLHLFFFVGF
jgi:hypothetical protein